MERGKEPSLLSAAIFLRQMPDNLDSGVGSRQMIAQVRDQIPLPVLARSPDAAGPELLD
jgi:hypothetical protein